MKRDPYMDNLRCFLIILVVIGHFLSKVSVIDEYQYLYYFIYTFHMPLFIFVSGYFSKGLVKNGAFQSKKFFSLLWMFLIFRLLSYAITIHYKGFYILKLFDVGEAPWYLLSLCLWYLTIPIIRNYKAKFVIPITLIISILIGFDTSVGTGFSLSRTITFFPFFCLGYYMTPEFLDTLLKKKLRIPSILLLGGTLGLFLWKGNLFAKFIKFAYGATPYKEILKKDYYLTGPLYRCTWYLVAVVMSIAVMYIIPRCHTWFTYIGQRTLSVYVIHILVRNILVYEGFFKYILAVPRIYTLFIFVICIAIVFLSSISIVYRPFSYLMAHPFFTGIFKKKQIRSES